MLHVSHFQNKAISSSRPDRYSRQFGSDYAGVWKPTVPKGIVTHSLKGEEGERRLYLL